MPIRTLSEYLDKNAINYRCYNHPPASTASEVAESVHIPGRLLAKTVILCADGQLVMAVLPSDHQVDVEQLKSVIGAGELRLAEESEFMHRFPDCETGGMPPLGNLYKMKVFMEKSFESADWFAFNAGSHTEVMVMDVGEFIRLVKPVLCRFNRLH
jgi:Ala-tRNA(Pro) deacylase